MAHKLPPQRPHKSEFQLILEFIGLKTILIVGLGLSLYMFSGYFNYMNEMRFSRAFSPYYALQLHNVARAADNTGEALSNWFDRQARWVNTQLDRLGSFIQAFLRKHVDPLMRTNPVMGFFLFFATGLLITFIGFYLIGLTLRKSYQLLFPAPRPSRQGGYTKTEDLWNFDPRRKPTDDQIKQLTRNLERLVIRAPAMGGSVPKGADISIKELAMRNRDSDYNYRCAVYVMGPIKGTKYGNSHDLPLALDQVKRIAKQMGPAASYETLPLDLVIMRTKKGTKNVEIDPETAPVNLGKSYPVASLEKVMTTNRNYFIWDQRASKSRTGHGLHHM